MTRLCVSAVVDSVRTQGESSQYLLLAGLAKRRANSGPLQEYLMTYKADTFKIGRDAKTGHFIPVKDAIRKADKAVVETIKKPK